MRCRPEQVIILTSSQPALRLLATMLLDAGDDVWLETPGYPGRVMRLSRRTLSWYSA